MNDFKIIFSAFGISFLIYLAGSFGHASFDISTWGETGRNMIAFLLCMGFFGAILLLTINKNMVG